MSSFSNCGDKLRIKGTVNFDLNIAEIGVAIYVSNGFLKRIRIKAGGRLKGTVPINKPGFPDSTIIRLRLSMSA